jgi:hypothetical protein
MQNPTRPATDGAENLTDLPAYSQTRRRVLPPQGANAAFRNEMQRFNFALAKNCFNNEHVCLLLH